MRANFTPRCVHCESKLVKDKSLDMDIDGKRKTATRYFCTDGKCSVAQVLIYMGKLNIGYGWIQKHLTTVG